MRGLGSEGWGERAGVRGLGSDELFAKVYGVQAPDPRLIEPTCSVRCRGTSSRHCIH